MLRATKLKEVSVILITNTEPSRSRDCNLSYGRVDLLREPFAACVQVVGTYGVWPPYLSDVYTPARKSLVNEALWSA